MASSSLQKKGVRATKPKVSPSSYPPPPGLMSSAPVHTTVIFKRREQVITILSQIGFDQKKR
jgi:hypothetical protein